MAGVVGYRWLEGMIGGWLEGMVGGMVGFIQFAHHRSGDYRLKVARTIPFFTQKRHFCQLFNPESAQTHPIGHQQLS